MPPITLFYIIIIPQLGYIRQAKKKISLTILIKPFIILDEPKKGILNL